MNTTCAAPELHHQHLTGQVSGGLAGPEHLTRTSGVLATRYGAQVRRRSRSYRLHPRAAPSGLPEPEIRSGVPCAGGKARRPRLVGGLDEIRLLRSTDVRAKKNPDVGAPYQVRAALDIRLHSQKAEFVAA